jgi:hypothetical protein
MVWRGVFVVVVWCSAKQVRQTGGDGKEIMQGCLVPAARALCFVEEKEWELWEGWEL